VRLVKAYGKDAYQVLGDAKSEDDLGHLFGWDLYQREVQWLMDHEYACTADDIIWRRSKLGLRLTQEEVASLEHWMQTEGLTQRALAS
jgi:glycerol-3-phosphate dehydrogenase